MDFLLFFMLASTLLLPQTSCSSPALFLFGDSIADTGNNNRLFTLIQANFIPFGENFVDNRPTGRFTDGKLLVDYLATFLGLPFVPPYLLAEEDILEGVSFASSGSGILDSTGELYGQHMPLSQQVDSFVKVKESVDAMLGLKNSSDLVSKSLYLIVTGSNDFLEHYHAISFLNPLRDYVTVDFQAKLLSQLVLQIQRLYTVGARKIAIISVPAIGCVPSLLCKSQGQCVASLNQAVQRYNTALIAELQELRSGNLSDAHLIYLNSFDLSLQIVRNPSTFGLKEAKTACCGWGDYNGATACLPMIDELCQNASEHVFWDFVHPTSAAYGLAAERFWGGAKPDVDPMNLQQLSDL